MNKTLVACHYAWAFTCISYFTLQICFMAYYGTTEMYDPSPMIRWTEAVLCVYITIWFIFEVKRKVVKAINEPTA